MCLPVSHVPASELCIFNYYNVKNKKINKKARAMVQVKQGSLRGGVGLRCTRGGAGTSRPR